MSRAMRRANEADLRRLKELLEGLSQQSPSGFG
jgi:hypothetical protein